KPFQAGLSQFHLIAHFELGARAAKLIVDRIWRLSESPRDLLVGQAACGQPHHGDLRRRELRQYRRLFEPDLRPDDRTKKLGDELIEITEIGGVPTPYCIGIVDAKKTENLVFHLQSPRQFRFRAKTSPVFADTGATCEALIDRPARPPHLLNRPYLI